jgi:predicted phage terminase large subunit-like protein
MARQRDEDSLEEKLSRMVAESLDPSSSSDDDPQLVEARSSFEGFVRFIMPDYEMNWHHQVFCDAIERWVKGLTHRLMIFAAPQSGKSCLVSRFLPAYLFGLNPDEAVVASSYNGELATKNNVDVQRVIDSDRYSQVFPFTRIASDSKGDSGWKRNARLFEIVGRKGIYFCGGTKTGLSGRPFHCFPAGTPVETDFGGLGIEFVTPGTMVWSYDHDRGCKKLRRVLACVKHLTPELVRITTESGVQITCTPNHKLYDCVGKNTYREAASFRPHADCLATAPENRRKPWTWKMDEVVSVECLTVPEQTVYDLQVEGNKNYFASRCLVSNSAVIDDLYKDDKDANSPTIQEAVFNWYVTVFLARKSRAGARILIINTRWSMRDLCGTLLDMAAKDPKADQWEVVSFPALLESEEQRNPGDNREIGEALWPSRQSRKELENTRAIAGTSKWSCVYQQNPTPDKGVFFSRDNFRYFDTEMDNRGVMWVVLHDGDEREPRRFELHNCEFVWFQTCDAADTMAMRSDYTAMLTCFRTPEADLCYWHYIRIKIDYPKRYKTVTGMRDGSPDEGPWPVPIGFQSMEAKASGISMIQQAAVDGRPFRPLKPGTSNKAQRAAHIITMYENHKVFHRRGRRWLSDFEKELISFPAGRHDEAIDCCLVAETVISTPDGEVEIQNIRAGDLVDTRNGPRRVVVSKMTDSDASVFRLETSDGRHLVGTGGHPVWVEGRGFVRLDCISYGDTIPAWQKKDRGQRMSRKWLSMASLSDATPTRNTRTIAATFSEGLLPASSICTDTSGARKKAISRRVFTSIIKTKTPSITTSPTWNVYQRAPTPNTTLLAGITDHQNISPTSNESDPARSPGINLPRAANGTQKTRSRLLKSVHSASTPASTVGQLSHRTVSKRTALNSALTPARLPLAENLASITRTETALGAVKSSVSVNTARQKTAPWCVRIEYVGRRPVFGVEVEGEHEYFANGVLTHNCAYSGIIAMQLSGTRQFDGELIVGAEMPRDSEGRISLKNTSLDPNPGTYRICGIDVQFDDD